jgi:hypothetical protein
MDIGKSKKLLGGAYPNDELILDASSGGAGGDGSPDRPFARLFSLRRAAWF